jgi:hypothetical protein
MPTNNYGPWHTLRVIRERGGFGQAALARASTISGSHLCDLELGRRWPPPEVTVKLNVSRVPKHAYIYDDTLLGLGETPLVGIIDALGTRFDYAELIGSNAMRSVISSDRCLYKARLRAVSLHQDRATS